MMMEILGDFSNLKAGNTASFENSRQACKGVYGAQRYRSFAFCVRVA
jgi:hypothetical protein